MSLTDEDKQWIRDELRAGLQEVVALIADVKASLEREMHEGFALMAARFNNASARLDRHAAYWQTGRRWSGRMEEWAEKIAKASKSKTAR